VPAADSHDRIEVRGARENNLADISLDLPKRRLTVFTGVSGSGKSSLVFGTIAAESQRLINETYTAFIQSFMPSIGRPDVDALRNLSAAIVVDGGQVVFTGTPAELVATSDTLTARHLRGYLAGTGASPAEPVAAARTGGPG
jgi:excinuclease UvrABC ATPase subunit